MSAEPDTNGELAGEITPLPGATAHSKKQHQLKVHHHRWRSDVVVRGAAIFVAILVISVASTGNVLLGVADTIVIASAWATAFYLVESATHSVRVAIGAFGVALFGTFAGAAATAALAFLIPPLQITGPELALMTAAVLAAAAAWSFATRRIAVLKTRVLVVGVTASSRELVETLAHERTSEFELIGFVDQQAAVEAVGGIPVIGQVRDLEAIVRLAMPDLVLLSVERGRPDVFARLAAVAGLGFRVVGLPEFYEHAFGRLPVRHITDAWFMSILHVYQRPYSALGKRIFDVTVSLAVLLLTAPLFPLIALYVRTSHGPILYRQVRLGEHGKPFEIIKFRTMRHNAESGRAVWAEVDDPRITAIGRLLRQMRLDELPQLWNVLRGEMSIVGPRPERPDFLSELEEAIPFWSRRHLLRPGVTGWAQIKSGYAADTLATETKLAYDLWYLRHRRLIVDMMICLQTLPRLLAKGGR